MGCTPLAQEQAAAVRGGAASSEPQTAGEGEAGPHAGHVATATTHAICVLVPVGDSGVSGVVNFAREGDGVHVSGEVTGLTPGKHAFHVHDFGDLTDLEEGKSAGDHYNPTGHPHGRPEDTQRHIGDFGNIEADASGHARIDFMDRVIRLDGSLAIVGHALVIHAQADKFTQPSGDAGGRVALGVIGIAKPLK